MEDCASPVGRRWLDSQGFGPPEPNSWGADVFTFGSNDRSDPSYQFELVAQTQEPPGPAADDIRSKLAWLGARAKLHELNMRYCRATDRCDLELWKTTFHPDGTGDYGFARGNGWEFGAKALPMLRERYATTHHCLGHEYFVIDGNRAQGEISIVSLQSSKAKPSEAEFLSGRYLDQYEHRGGQWVIMSRRFIPDPWDAQRFGALQPNAGSAKSSTSAPMIGPIPPIGMN